ncbi:MAG TPA: hypothetical protein VKZ97_10340 [Flavobacteriaceae bacterium]|nr:hypothetical protein [Flavobacteriaceae bacterium]
MKRIIVFLGLFLLSFSAISQETYTVKNEILELKTEVEGKLDLLWNIIDGNYRYFVKTETGDIQELVNTKADKGYNEEFKTTLNSLTGNSAEAVNLTLFSLKEYIMAYNESMGASYSTNRAQLGGRLGGFVGLTNSPFAENPENASVPFFGAELEFFQKKEMPRHAGFFDVRHALDSDDFPYSETQLALGYRYRFINKPGFNIYGQVKVVTYSFARVEYTYLDSEDPGVLITETETGSTFEAPLIFGLGADIKVGSNGYVTLTYGEIIAVFIDLQDNFPMDFAIGYKFNL